MYDTRIAFYTITQNCNLCYNVMSTKMFLVIKIKNYDEIYI